MSAARSVTTATIVVVNTITGAIYDTWFGHLRAAAAEQAASSSGAIRAFEGPVKRNNHLPGRSVRIALDAFEALWSAPWS